ncbi:hypothetical protein A1O3_03239 [Capronia epimyces CBS 606.96]|uniref:Cytochrome P450 oxidoreductase n=1 Tax=Capronia epimyces CBS 606.96 TaxID=1182542 RepID=W9YKF0_9EURO|nr:uncharacterized protein A1O3_03239 [Capronia epimyces CBS 606.96]EXJ90170.1 hypothetical protein A1O3_03239 [Capronia epimyces CBS 606.96]
MAAVLDRGWPLSTTTSTTYGAVLVVLTIGQVVLSLGAKLVYNLYFHPLAAYPGPLLARCSRLWYTNALVRGNLPFVVHQAHEKYGEIVRIAPDELAYIDARAWKDIYGPRPGRHEIPKDPNFYLNTSVGDVSIIGADSVRHGKLRRLLSHGFSERALQDQVPIIQDYVDLFIARLRVLSKKPEPVDIVTWYNFFTFDVIGDLAFAESFGCLETSKYHPWIDFMFEVIVGGTYKRAADHYPLVGRLMKLLTPERVKQGVAAHLALMKHKAMHRLELKTDRLDFMTRMAAPDSGLTPEEFIASADTILLGGSETTATLLSGITYYLLKHPAVLDKLVEEIRTKFSSEEEIDLVSVNTLDYMLACLNETFRLYPPVPGALPRRTVVGEALAGSYVPPNTTVAIYHWAMYRTGRHFKRPLEYLPERWLKESWFEEDDRSVMQSFSYGPRNCIGRNLAYVEMRLLLARMLFSFDIEATPAIEGWLDQKVYLLWQKPPLWIKLKPRDVKLRPQVVKLLEQSEQPSAT